MAEQKPVRIAVDIGGTFTDLQIQDARTGQVHALKTPSTPQDPSIGLITGVEEAAARFGFAPTEIGRLLHGSTIATNAVLERKLPKGALITTRGFEDVLEIGRHMRKDVYALKAEPRSVLIPRQLRFGVAERITADGAVETPLDEDAVGELAIRLVELGVEAVAIMFLHGYRNPVHEERAREILLTAAPDLSVSTSFEVSPEIREFERCSTTVLNALLQPVISGYLTQVRARLAAAGVSAPLYLVQSNGGVVSPEDAARLPAKLLLSGPAGGAMAMDALAKQHGRLNLVGIDMGGTSSDVSVVTDGAIGETTESEIDGLPVRLPMIDIRTIGAGGGSLASVQQGALRVGPESAGAEPGPACYGRGGKRPTVTDGNVVLGRVDPEAFLGGEMVLQVESSREAFDVNICKNLNLSDAAAAEGVVAVANTHMAGAVRLSLFEKGADPADFSLVPFGGAAGLHACALAEELAVSEIIFPSNASTLSARGILDADLRWDFSKSAMTVATPDTLASLSTKMAELVADAARKLEQEQIPETDQQIEISADLRYRGQAYEITTPWLEISAADAHADSAALKALCDRFHELHQTRFSHNAPDDLVEVVALRAVATGKLEKHGARAAERAVPAPESTEREVCIAGKWRTVPTISREEALAAGAPMTGPLLVCEEYTVLLIAPGWQLSPLGHGDLLARRIGETA
ncbi:MAG: hydantoinase/oxoprolinase family protein [Alphaproteobacteria bacterium]|nr:hydantoinase/oxoprolinase family protein [Alphaproteobacteria bacterium]